MKRKQHGPARIIAKLRKVDAMLTAGASLALLAFAGLGLLRRRRRFGCREPFDPGDAIQAVPASLSRARPCSSLVDARPRNEMLTAESRFRFAPSGFVLTLIALLTGEPALTSPQGACQPASRCPRMPAC